VTAASRAQFAELVRSEQVDVALACLLVGCESEPDLDLRASLAVLDALAATALPQVLRLGAAEGLRVALGEQAGFGGTASDADDLRSSLLHEVLRRGRGLPITLSVVWCEVAARLDVIAVPLGLPGKVLVAVDDVVVDPFEGGRVVAAAAEPVLQPVELLLRLLTNIRVLTTRQERSLESARTRLWATELSLLLPRHPLGLRRERGELLVRLGDHLGGAAELEEYASLVEDVDEAEAEKGRRQARLARARLN
jgi:regulator of sirC expression with transglutaminase-like and TPR domain